MTRLHHFTGVPLGSDWALPFTIDGSLVGGVGWGASDIVELGISGSEGFMDYGSHQSGPFHEYVASSSSGDGIVTLRQPFYVDVQVPAGTLSRFGRGTVEVRVRHVNPSLLTSRVLLAGRLPIY